MTSRTSGAPEPFQPHRGMGRQITSRDAARRSTRLRPSVILSAVIDEDFGRMFRTTVNTGGTNPRIHLMFNEWWRHAPDDVVRAYVDTLTADPDLADLVSGAQWASPVNLDDLVGLPDGSFGRAYCDWIADNDLNPRIASDYQRWHMELAAAGELDDMPEPVRHAVVRLFQTHDFQHLVTGYGSCPQGEIAMFAFCLAQIRFPYFAMWVSAMTADICFVQPELIEPMMDAIADGWQLGRSVRNIQAERWEEMLAEPLAEVRARYGITPTPLARSLAAVPS